MRLTASCRSATVSTRGWRISSNSWSGNCASSASTSRAAVSPVASEITCSSTGVLAIARTLSAVRAQLARERAAADHLVSSAARTAAQLAVGRDEHVRPVERGRLARDPVVGALAAAADRPVRRGAVEDDQRLVAVRGRPRLRRRHELGLGDVRPLRAEDVPRVDDQQRHAGGPSSPERLTALSHRLRANCRRMRRLIVLAAALLALAAAATAKAAPAADPLPGTW